jgi:predicted GNAT family N-acyltransferase
MHETKIKKARWSIDEISIKSVRIPVFVEEQNVPFEIDFDEFDTVATHWLAYSDGQGPVGTARLLDDGHFGRMAVLKTYRQLGIGRTIILTALDFAREAGMTKVYLHAQLPAQAFYESVGFVAYGDIFVDANMDHIAMEVTIQGSI